MTQLANSTGTTSYELTVWLLFDVLILENLFQSGSVVCKDPGAIGILHVMVHAISWGQKWGRPVNLIHLLVHNGICSWGKVRDFQACRRACGSRGQDVEMACEA